MHGERIKKRIKILYVTLLRVSVDKNNNTDISGCCVKGQQLIGGLIKLTGVEVCVMLVTHA
jgi:hypothetical protein